MGLNDFSLFFLSFSLQKSRNLFFLSLSLTFVFLLCIFYPVFDTHKKNIPFPSSPHHILSMSETFTVVWHNHHQLPFLQVHKKINGSLPTNTHTHFRLRPFAVSPTNPKIHITSPARIQGKDEHTGSSH